MKDEIYWHIPMVWATVAMQTSHNPSSAQWIAKDSGSSLSKRSKAATIYWCHWNNFPNCIMELKTTCSKCDICHIYCVSFFWSMAGTFFVFSSVGCSLFRPSHYVFVRLSRSLLLYLFCIRRNLVPEHNSQGDRDRHTDVWGKSRKINMSIENVLIKVPKAKLSLKLLRTEHTIFYRCEVLPPYVQWAVILVSMDQNRPKSITFHFRERIGSNNAPKIQNGEM